MENVWTSVKSWQLWFSKKRWFRTDELNHGFVLKMIRSHIISTNALEHVHSHTREYKMIHSFKLKGTQLTDSGKEKFRGDAILIPINIESKRSNRFQENPKYSRNIFKCSNWLTDSKKASAPKTSVNFLEQQWHVWWSRYVYVYHWQVITFFWCFFAASFSPLLFCGAESPMTTSNLIEILLNLFGIYLVRSINKQIGVRIESSWKGASWIGWAGTLA